jgi:hypothetical protein
VNTGSRSTSAGARKKSGVSDEHENASGNNIAAAFKGLPDSAGGKTSAPVDHSGVWNHPDRWLCDPEGIQVRPFKPQRRKRVVAG